MLQKHFSGLTLVIVISLTMTYSLLLTFRGDKCILFIQSLSYVDIAVLYNM